MKRLIICSDGLWNTRAPTHSNVGLLMTAIDTKAEDGRAQLTLCDPFQQYAATHQGALKNSICTLYRQLALNYFPGDELWFLGFSRGSTVVRHCIDLIRNCGLLRKENIDKVTTAWHVYRSHWGPDASNAVIFRDRYSQVPSIKFLGIWDTVGRFGHPDVGGNTSDPLTFHDNSLSSQVENACHALAIDERRRDLSPCLWKASAVAARSEQCWFSGTHRDIGGILGNLALANISLDWMASRATSLGLSLDIPLLTAAMEQRGSTSKEDVYGAAVRKTGVAYRDIGVTSHDETVHSSAEQRFLRDAGYRPANLKSFFARNDQIQLPL